VFDWPKDGNLVVPMAGKVSKAYLLADKGKALEVSAGANGVTIKVPAQPLNPHATVVVVEVAREVQPK
jgi:alpha-L-fucosidase